MSATDKAKNTAQDVKGKVKERVGHVTGDDRMEAEGRGDQAAAKLKQAGEQAKDTVKHGVEAAKGAVKEGVGKVTGDDRLAEQGQAEQDVARLKEDRDK